MKISKLLSALQSCSHKDYAYTDAYASFGLPFDQKFLDDSRKMSEKFQNYKNIAVIGIGWSNLGTMAIYSAAASLAHKDKEIFFFDTTDPTDAKATLEKIENKLEKWEKLVLTVISKSWGTTETLAFAAWISHVLLKEFPEQIRIVTISNTDSKLDRIACKEGWERLHLPEKVWGRFSVFSSVGLFPLLFLGLDAEKLLTGARTAIEDFMKAPQEHISYIVADTLYREFPKRNIFEHWFFSKKMENLGKWYRQLLAESIGKIRESESVGITPVIAIGTIDLHSVAQLSLARPEDRTVAIISEKNQDEIVIKPSAFLEILPHLEGKTFSGVMNAAKNWFVAALKTKDISVFEYEIDTKHLESIAYWMQTKMLEIAIMGEMFEIDAFDQPNVEEYKSGMERELKQ